MKTQIISGRLHRQAQIFFFLVLALPSWQSHNDISYLSHCEFAYHLKKDEICINPYHYIKTEPEFIQPQSPQQHQQLSILVPKFPTSSPESSTSYLDGFSNTVPLNIQYHALK
jgi:mothers against decapentaplegic homolog 3